MANQYISTKRTEQGALPASGSTLVPCVDSGVSTVHTVDELATAIGGYTVPVISQASVRSAKVGANDVLNNLVLPNAYSWSALDHDDGGWWSVGDPTRLTVPAGGTKVMVSASMFLSGGGSISIIKNGDSTAPLCKDGTGGIFQNITTGIITVTAGDYFEVYMDGAATSTTNNTPITWFSIVEIEGAP